MLWEKGDEKPNRPVAEDFFESAPAGNETEKEIVKRNSSHVLPLGPVAKRSDNVAEDFLRSILSGVEKQFGTPGSNASNDSSVVKRSDDVAEDFSNSVLSGIEKQHGPRSSYASLDSSLVERSSWRWGSTAAPKNVTASEETIRATKRDASGLFDKNTSRVRAHWEEEMKDRLDAQHKSGRHQLEMESEHWAEYDVKLKKAERARKKLSKAQGKLDKAMAKVEKIKAEEGPMGSPKLEKAKKKVQKASDKVLKAQAKVDEIMGITSKPKTDKDGRLLEVDTEVDEHMEAEKLTVRSADTKPTMTLEDAIRELEKAAQELNVAAEKSHDAKMKLAGAWEDQKDPHERLPKAMNAQGNRAEDSQKHVEEALVETKHEINDAKEIIEESKRVNNMDPQPEKADGEEDDEEEGKNEEEDQDDNEGDEKEEDREEHDEGEEDDGKGMKDVEEGEDEGYEEEDEDEEDEQAPPQRIEDVKAKLDSMSQEFMNTAIEAQVAKKAEESLRYRKQRRSEPHGKTMAKLKKHYADAMRRIQEATIALQDVTGPILDSNPEAEQKSNNEKRAVSVAELRQKLDDAAKELKELEEKVQKIQQSTTQPLEQRAEGHKKTMADLKQELADMMANVEKATKELQDTAELNKEVQQSQ